MDELRRWASAALSWIDEIYPADIFDGSSGDEGPVRIVEIRENLRQALNTTNPGQGALEPLWRDTDIYQHLESVCIDDAMVLVWDAHKLMIVMRDEYESKLDELEAERATLTERIATLEAQLASARKWLPDSALEDEDE